MLHAPQNKKFGTENCRSESEALYQVKRITFFIFCTLVLLSSTRVFAQSLQNSYPDAASENIVQEMQKTDPQTAQAFSAAIQRGDFQTAKKIYEDYKNSKNIAAPQSNIRTKPTGTAEQSILERTLSGKLPMDVFSADPQQFGYELFMKTASSFAPTASVPVGPDYLIGPGDQFVLTLWGTTEGIYTIQVTKEGNITLPKVGVVSVAGLRFGALESTLRRHLSRYYSNFNLSVAMGSLKTITVYVVGEVENPGSYSLPSLSTVYSALFSAGGPTKKGTLRMIQVRRSGKVVKTIDLYDFLLKGDRSQDIRLHQGDTVFVPLIGPIVGVSGTVYRPAIYEMKGGETLGDVIQTAGGIMPVSLASRLQLTRFSDNQKKVVLDIQVTGPLAIAASAKLKEPVMNMDVIHVLPIYDQVWETVSLQGDVRHPGVFQWRQDLKLKEIVQEGQLLPTADIAKGEIIRLSDDYRDRTIIPFNLDALLKGDESQNIPLRPKDQVRIFTLFREVEKVTVSGEIMSSATGTVEEKYEIHKGERLSDLLRRLGGFTPQAYPYGTVFKRKGVKNAQAQNLQIFINKMQSQMLQSSAAGAAKASNPEEAAAAKGEMAINQGLLENLKSMQQQLEGRISINITEDIDSWAGSKDDLLLQDEDSIVIPKRPQEVIVMGEVRNPGAEVYEPQLQVKDYLNQNGGLTDYAAKGQIFVVQANGFAVSSDTPSVGNVEKITLHAGDTIIVPQKVDRYVGWRWTKEILDVLFKLAVMAATLNFIF